MKVRSFFDWVQAIGSIGSLALAIVVFWVGYQQQEIAEDNQRHELMSNYFDIMTSLLLDKEENFNSASEKAEKLAIGTAMTVTTLRQLNGDGERRGELLKFLHRANLIKRCDDNSNECKLAIQLNKAKLDEVNIKPEFKVSLEKANLANASLVKAVLPGISLSRADLTSADLSKATLNEAHLIEANLTSAKLENANLSDAKLMQATLTGADLSSANLRCSNLVNATLNSPKTEDFNFQNDATKLENVDFSNAVLINAKLEKTNLKGAIFNGANLQSANFASANLTGAVLQGAKLKTSIYDDGESISAECKQLKKITAFKNQELVGANFSGANLKGVNLQGVNLDGVNFTGAKLDEADLRNADLRNAKLQNTSLVGAIYSAETKLPAGFDAEAVGMRQIIPIANRERQFWSLLRQDRIGELISFLFSKHS